MNYTRLTPLKEDLLAARKKLGQQDGKILLLSSQLEKKRNLAAEFEGQVQRLTTTVKERDVEITNLHGNLRKPQEAVALRPADGDAQVEAMLLHWQRSAGYRYVISGKDSNNFMSSPQNRLLSSVKKANRSFTFSPSPSPIPMGSSSPKASDRCPFPLSFQKKLFSPPAAPAHVAVPKSAPKGIAALQQSRYPSVDLCDHTLDGNELDETFLSEDMDLSFYPLDTTLDQCASSPSPVRSARPPMPPPTSTGTGTGPLTALSPASFYDKIHTMRDESDRIRGDISRFKGRMEGLHAACYYSQSQSSSSHTSKGKDKGIAQSHQPPRPPMRDISNLNVSTSSSHQRGRAFC